MVDEEVLIWRCPLCGKLIKSLYRAQLEYNKYAHLKSHAIKGEVSLDDL
ncbi:MAG: hypothetical protein QXS32_08465 [Candidatus Nezhaarchaeales archaeon]